MEQLSGRTVLVSGATGAVGRELVRLALEGGAKLGIAVRRRWQVEKVGAGLPRERTLVGLVETGDGEAAAGFVKGVEDSLGPIDSLLSASGSFLFARAGSEQTGDAQALFDANLFAPLTLVRAVVGLMQRRRTGSMVFTGARAALDGAIAGMSLYIAAKSALHACARCLAVELREAGIRVAVVAPSIIDTEANRVAMPDADRSSWLPAAAVAAALLQAAAGRLPGPGPLYPLPA